MLVILYKRDSEGVSRYYTLDDRQQHLFNSFDLTVSWGKYPQGGRSRQYQFATLEEKDRFIRKLLARKLRDHQVLYSYFREQNESLMAGRRSFLDPEQKKLPSQQG